MNSLVSAVLEQCLGLETKEMPVELGEDGQITIWLPEALEADPSLAARVTERRLCMLLEDSAQTRLVEQLNTYSSITSMNVAVDRFNLPSAKTWVLAPDLEDDDLQTDLISLYGITLSQSDSGFTATVEGELPVTAATQGEAVARAALQAKGV